MQRSWLPHFLARNEWIYGVMASVFLSGFCVVAFVFFIVGSRYGWLFGSITLFIAAVFNVIWPLLRPSVIAWTVSLSPFIWIISIGGVHLALGRNPSQSDIEHSGTPIVQQLEAYHAKYGYYPESLKVAGIVSPRYRCGSLKYARENANRFSLVIGNYDLDGFTVWWQPEKNSWYWDT